MQQANLIQEWVNSDKKLYDILVEIQREEKDVKKQASLALHKIPKMYGLPTFPEDNENDDFPSSVYEILGFHNFLEPDGDIRGHVLSSIFYVKEGYEIDMSLVFQKKFGSGTPPEDFTGIGYKGEGIEASIVFVMKNQSWYDLECKYFIKKI